MNGCVLKRKLGKIAARPVAVKAIQLMTSSNDQNLWMALGGNAKERTLPRKI
jgi:hypothetical protein